MCFYMNKKGFAATGILYTILVLFILLISSLLGMLYSRNNLLHQIQKEVMSELSPVYPVYSNATPVYFNPVTGNLCSEYISSNSLNEYNNGCMKWYIFNDNSTSSTVNMILDHNTTGLLAWNSTINNLASDTLSWVSGLNPRLISADEIAQITGNTTFNQATTTSSDWFYLDSLSQTRTATIQGASNYTWLYDYTIACTSYGCNVADESTYGYWTSATVAYNSANVWGMDRSGSLRNYAGNSVTSYGVRPVITISKYTLEQQEYVVTNMISNGSFEDDFTNWNSNLFGKGGGTLSTDLAYDGAHSVFINAIGDSKEKAIGYNDSLSFVANHQYYLAMRNNLKSFTSNSSTVIPIASLFDSTANFVTILCDHTILNSWQLSSKIFSLSDNRTATNQRFGHIYNNNSIYQLYIDSIVLVDLTEAFGAGNEPSIEWCDQNLTWFEGSKTVYK